jgi:peptide/nickel transport system substrate-binding protein
MQKKKKFVGQILALMVIAFLVATFSGVGEASPGKTLNIALSENVVDLDPHNANNMASYQPVYMVYDSLVESDHVGHYTPSLATGWKFSPDGCTMTLKLRKGVKFHNGEKFDSADVVCTFERILEDKTLAVSNYWTLLKSVKAIDDYTVQLVTAKPYSGMMLSLVITAIIPNEAYAKYGKKLFTDQIMYGTGPWKFDKWVDGQYFHVTKNKNYWNKKFNSYYKDIYVRRVAEPSTAIAGHIAGQIQAYVANGGINLDMLRLYKGHENKIKLIKIKTATTIFIALQCGKDSVFNDINARKAFDYAIDRQSIVKHIYGDAVVPRSFMPKGMPGYSDAIPTYVYSPKKAKEYLAKTSYKGSLITITGNKATKKGEEVLLAVSEMLNAVGFNTKVNIVESATLDEMRASGKYDAYIMGNMLQCGVPTRTLNMRIRNDVHHSYYKDPELNALIDKYNTELNVKAGNKLLTEILMKWREASVHSYVAQLVATYAVDYGVTGIGLYEDGYYSFKYASYNPKQGTK